MSGNEPLLSFLCVSYNHENYIEDCIKSIWNNDYKNIEIIALDDGSKDNSVRVLNKLREQSPCAMTVIAQENTGCIGANFNKLFKQAQGKFISIIACDDKLMENSIDIKMQELINNDKLTYICHSKIICINENNEVMPDYPTMKLDTIESPTSEDILNLDFNDIHSYYTQGSIYKKELIDNINGFDEDMVCDDIILRTKISRYLLAHKELSFKVLKTPGVYYRRHSNNVSSNSLRQIKGVMQYFQRYWPDKIPSKAFYTWLENSAKTKEELLQIFLDDNQYRANVFSHINPKYLKGILFQEYEPYKKVGLPYIFQICTYSKNGKKIKVLKLFCIKIASWEKRKH